MKKGLVSGLIMLTVIGFLLATTAFGADIDLAKKSTIEQIMKRGELRVGFESGYVPFEMTNKKGEFIGFDMDFGRRLAKSMGVKFVPINTAWDGIIPALMTDKVDIIMGGMTITQERNLKVNFAQPYIVVGQTILLNKKLKDIGGNIETWQRIDNLTGHSQDENIKYDTENCTSNLEDK